MPEVDNGRHAGDVILLGNAFIRDLHKVNANVITIIINVLQLNENLPALLVILIICNRK